MFDEKSKFLFENIFIEKKISSQLTQILLRRYIAKLDRISYPNRVKFQINQSLKSNQFLFYHRFFY